MTNKELIKFTQKDTSYMQQALLLAHNAKGTTFPNPSVGAVVVKNQKIIGWGATAQAGGPHAEKTALAMAGKKAFGATLYVTLEPCCHFGRTPPCTDAIILAGIKHVMYAASDPNPLVNGKGARVLKKAGIAITCGLLAKEANRLNEDFNYSITIKKPFISLKLAMTLDGRIADSAGSSKWITSQKSRDAVHELRRKHAGIIVGRSTLLADNPMLTVRHVLGASPVRFVFASTSSVPKNTHFVTESKKIRSILVVMGGKKESKKPHESGIEIWKTGKSTSKDNLHAFLSMAYSEGISSLFVEGGSKVASLFFENKLVNRVFFFYGNKILGSGLNGLSTIQQLPMINAATLINPEITQLDGDFMISGIVSWKDA